MSTRIGQLLHSLLAAGVQVPHDADEETGTDSDQ
jgi:hypothetical protein